MYSRYVDRVCAEIENAERLAARLGARFERQVDTIYVGGGTPTVLDPADLERIFAAVRTQFEVTLDAEVTAECAPGTLKPEIVDSLLRCAVNRVSLGVQSFVDREAASVGRLHTRAVVLEDLARLRAARIGNISIDLIAGLPHQTKESWHYSLEETINSGVPHVSVYMLEVDEDSRLGQELLAGGARYHAHFVPDDDLTAELYLECCEALEHAGLLQYEISNFANGPIAEDGLPCAHSRHNLKYWTRQPYMGFGVDAHSMLPAQESELEAVRFATADNLEQYVSGKDLAITPVGPAEAIEERCFLGLRLNRGILLSDLSFGELENIVAELQEQGLLQVAGEWVRLTDRGRLLSNEVFERFLKA